MTNTVGQALVLAHVGQRVKNASNQSNYNQEMEINNREGEQKFKDSAIPFQELYFPKATAR